MDRAAEWRDWMSEPDLCLLAINSAAHSNGTRPEMFDDSKSTCKSVRSLSLIFGVLKTLFSQSRRVHGSYGVLRASFSADRTICSAAASTLAKTCWSCKSLGARKGKH